MCQTIKTTSNRKIFSQNVDNFSWQIYIQIQQPKLNENMSSFPQPD